MTSPARKLKYRLSQTNDIHGCACISGVEYMQRSTDHAWHVPGILAVSEGQRLFHRKQAGATWQQTMPWGPIGVTYRDHELVAYFLCDTSISFRPGD